MYVRLCLCLSVLISAIKKKEMLSPNVLLPTLRYDLIFHFFFFRAVSSSPKPLFVLQHLFWSRRLACLWLLSGFSKFMLSSQCHVDISLHSQSSLQHFFSMRPSLTVFYRVSSKKFGICERILKFNVYIHVQNSNDTFTIPLTSDNFTESLLLVLRKWTKQNVWSNIPIRCLSCL
jgi:hypothetical protein